MNFVKVSKEQFEQWANETFQDNWKFALPTFGKELVVVAPLKNKGGLEFHIYTSCTEEAGETRDIGKDAIRVVLFDKLAGKSLSKEKRVNRTEGATTVFDRINDRIATLREIADETAFCKRCGAHLIERTNRSTGQTFMGCGAYPNCGGTNAIKDKYPVFFQDEESLNRLAKAVLQHEDAATNVVEGMGQTNAPTINVTQELSPIPETKLVEEKDCYPTSVYPHAHFPFPRFNRVQSTILKHEYWKQDVNLVLGTSTSSGKTVSAELFMGHTLQQGKKILYSGPLKSLTNEKFNDWTEQYPDKKVMILTGDYTLTDEKAALLNSADIICLTSEMVDSRTRNYQSEKSEWMFDVGLVVLDESHILSTTRGHAVEVGLMRFAELVPDARILCLSATLPNVEDFKQWLTTINEKKTKVINSSWRPTKLNWHFVPHASSGSYYAIQQDKMQRALDILQKNKTEKFLIFVHDKNTGRKLVSMLKHNSIDTVFHNADLNLKDRLKIEQSFSDREKGLRVLISTSTLAWGSLALGTEIYLISGIKKKIQELQIGDSILSYNEQDQHLEQDFVLNTQSYMSTEQYTIELEDGTEIIADKKHPVYIKTDEGEILEKLAKDLKEGDDVVLIDNLVS